VLYATGIIAYTVKGWKKHVLWRFSAVALLLIFIFLIKKYFLNFIFAKIIIFLKKHFVFCI